MSCDVFTELRALRDDWDAFLEETLRCGITAPAYLLDGVGCSLVLTKHHRV